MNRLLLTTFIFLFSGLAMASSLELEIERRLTEVLRTYDDRAYVVIEAVENTKETELPATPFVFEESSIQQNDKTTLKSLNITIFTRLEKIPQNLENFINKLGESYKVKPKFELINVPKEKLEPEEETFFEKYKEYIPAALATVMMLMFVYGWFQIRSRGKLATAIDAQLTNLSSAISQSGLGGGGGAARATEPATGGGLGGKTSIDINTSGGDNWNSYTIQSLVAILTDCYWCEEDEYAAFIWKKLSIEKRSQVLDNTGMLTDYVSFISSFDGADKGYIEEPYYMTPMPTFHLSNDALTTMVKEEPGLMFQLPQMRVGNLTLQAKERLQLYSAQNVDEFDVQKLAQAEASELRVFKKATAFTFTSLEEESEIISMEDVTVEIMEQFPSLAWLTKLTDESAKDLLNFYTAKQLASVWIAPEDVLQKLEAYLPDKKRELLLSYLKNTEPSRELLLYKELINSAIENYKSSMEEPEEKKAS